MFGKILVCLDRSSLAEQILPYACEVARVFSSELILLTVVEIPTPQSLEFPVETDLIEDLRRNEALTYLERIAFPLREGGLTVKTAVVDGSTGHAIVDYAAANAIELIAMDTHGRENVGRLVFGSVTDYVVRHTSIPVLSMKPRHREARPVGQ
jgi:nucleotide-binding universal stress UspA family protein